MHKKLLAFVLACIMAGSLLYGCSSAPSADETVSTESFAEKPTEAEIDETVAELTDEFTTIELSSVKNGDDTYSHSARLDGKEIPEFDYTWHSDPAGTYEEKDDAPAEYHTGTAPDDSEVYIAHDIYYYPSIDTSKFEKVNYDGETEWVTYYQSDEYKDYIYGTLPVKGSSVPTEMMHTEEDAYNNAVLHILKAGTYKLTGNWHGQVNIDLGDEASEDPDAVVTLILDGADIECTVAPGVIFKEVYECDNEWEDREEYSASVDTSKAGANIVIADGSDNYITGTNIFRMLKTKYKDDDSKDAVPVQKKIRKNDGALYSYMSMNIYGDEYGTGTLTVTSGNEGIDSELHLTINGGNINIYAQDDGINTNEDDVSVTTINSGDIRIVAGLGTEGDGIDSNGYLVINGGRLISLASPMADSGLDSSCGSYINGGEVLALGSTMDWAESDDSNDSGAVTMNLRFAQTQDSSEKIEIMDENGNMVFSYCQNDDPLVSDYQRFFSGAIISCEGLEVGKTYSVWIGGKQQGYSGNEVGGFPGEGRPQLKEGETPPEMPEGFEGKQPPEGFDGKQPPEGFDGKQPSEGFDRKSRTDDDGMKMPPQGSEGNMPPQWNSGDKPSMDKINENVPNEQITLNRDFVMEDKVNNFSGVQDY